MEHEKFMLVITWEDGALPFRSKARVSVDMATEIPNPPPTDAEMQAVAHAAKMAMAKVMRARSKKPRGDKEVP